MLFLQILAALVIFYAMVRIGMFETLAIIASVIGIAGLVMFLYYAHQHAAP